VKHEVPESHVDVRSNLLHMLVRIRRYDPALSGALQPRYEAELARLRAPAPLTALLRGEVRPARAAAAALHSSTMSHAAASLAA